MKHTTPVPNVLLDAALPDLKPIELKTLLVIIRQTAGWQKESDWISMRQFCEKTGASKRALGSAIAALQEAGWIEVTHRRKKRHFSPGMGKLFLCQTEQFAPALKQKVRPTKEKQTKQTCTESKKCSNGKIQSIREHLRAHGILRS